MSRIGYLIDGTWIKPDAIETVCYLIRGESPFGSPTPGWIEAKSLDVWNAAPEQDRAIQIMTNTTEALCEAPKRCRRFDLDLLMVETDPPKEAPGVHTFVPFEGKGVPIP